MSRAARAAERPINKDPEVTSRVTRHLISIDPARNRYPPIQTPQISRKKTRFWSELNLPQQQKWRCNNTIGRCSVGYTSCRKALLYSRCRSKFPKGCRKSGLANRFGPICGSITRHCRRKFGLLHLFKGVYKFGFKNGDWSPSFL